MAQPYSFYERHSFNEETTWEFIRERIGYGLRERYQVPKELPSKLLTLIRKLDAIEGNCLLRHLDATADPIQRSPPISSGH